MHDIDFHHVARAAVYLVASLGVVAVAKIARDGLAIRKGRDLNALIANDDNTAVAVEQAAFFVATVIGLLGALVVVGETVLDEAIDFGVTATYVIGALLLCEAWTLKLVLPRLDAVREVCDRGNVAVAIARSGGLLATAFVARAALHDDHETWHRLVWFVVGQALLVALTRLYQKLTPYDDVAELQHRNVAAALPLAGLQVALGLIIDAALRGESGGWTADLMSVGLDVLVAAALLPALRWMGDVLLLRGSTYAEEIARDRNTGAGVIEGASYLAGGFAVAYFLA
ncbi:MAG: DUF350 domain-containing protein [Deltaproteobacteria bacterium]|nr:DUF350 domain-containing protein [Deltaproteobacteria bacterium]